MPNTEYSVHEKWVTIRNVIKKDSGLPASHGVVSVEHLFAQLTVLDPTRELNVSELVTQELWPQEALEWHKIEQVTSNYRIKIFTWD